MEVGTGSSYTALKFDSPRARGRPPPNFAHYVHCDKMAGWIEVPLSMQVSLRVSDTVLDGALPQWKGHSKMSLGLLKFGGHPCTYWVLAIIQ